MSKKLDDLNKELEAKQEKLGKLFAAKPDFDYTSDEAAELRALNTELTDLGKKRDELRDLEQIHEQFERRGVNHLPAPAVAAVSSRDLRSIGERFVSDAAYKNARSEERRRLTIDMEDVDPMDVRGVKTTMSTGAGFEPDSPRTNRIMFTPTRRPVIADLIPQDTTALTVIKWMEETTFTNNAASTAEGGTLPESALAFTERTSIVEKIGHFIPVTDEQLEDVGQIRGIIDNRLIVMLDLVEEYQLLNGNGTSPQILGFMNKPGVLTQAKGTDPAPDALYKALTKVRTTAFTSPSGVVIHPNDWQDIRLLRTADGEYIWGNPSEAGPERVWGLPIVVTTAVTENTALIGDFSLYSHISRRKGVTLKTTDSHSDNFVKDIQVIKVEERLSLEIYRPSAFCLVTGL